MNSPLLQQLTASVALIEEEKRSARNQPGCAPKSATSDAEPSAAFTTWAGHVFMVTPAGPIRLTEDMCERLLDVWGEAEGPAAARLFNDLYDKHLSVGGVPR